MGFLSFWPLALLVLIPIIIILYILRQETKPKQFSSTMLWKEAVHNIEATKPWEKLKKNILLFLQIITVVLLILAMMGPWLNNVGKEQSQIVLVIDNSASMGTIYENEETRLEAAKAAACSYIDDLSSSTVIYVISGNQAAVLELANSTDHIEAKKVINNISQTALIGDMSGSLGLVSSCASQYEKPEIVFFTDSAFDIGDLDASVANFYSEGVNFSLDSISYAKNDNLMQVLVQVTNHSDVITKREVNLYGVDETGKKELLEIAEVDMGANETNSALLEIPIAKIDSVKSFEAEINEKDSLEGDNYSYCVLDKANDKTVLLLSESNLFVEKAFGNLAGVDIYRSDDPSVVNGEKKYDLYIFDGMVPENLPDTGNFLFINAEKEGYSKAAKSIKSVLLKMRETLVTSYVSDAEIGVNEAFIYELPAWAESYMESSEGSAGYFGIYDGHKVATMGFDLHQSDFGLQAEFPVLISNMSDYLLEASLTEKNSYIAGESLLLHGSTSGEDIVLVSPDDRKQTIDASEVLGSYMQVDLPGIYSVSQKLENGEKSQQFAVLFPFANESEVESPATMLGENGTAKSAEIKTGILELRNIILIILLILLLVEWYVYLSQK